MESTIIKDNMLKMKIVETNYNLKQSFIRARHSDNKSLLRSVVASIYTWNSVVSRIDPILIDDDLKRIGQIHHDRLLNGQEGMVLHAGLSITEDDFTW